MTTDDRADTDFSLLAFATLMLRRRWLFLRLTLLFGFVAAVWALATPRRYTSQATFVGRDGDTQSPLAGLASQFGVQVPATQSGFTPAFYAALVTSRTIMLGIVDSLPPWIPTANGKTTVDQLYKVRKKGAARRSAAMDKLIRFTSATATRETGIIHVAVTSPDPQASAAITGAIIDRVSEYHLQSRHFGATEERKFVEQRLGEAKADLARGEDALRTFLEHNRGPLGNSPQLQFEDQRLQREVDMRQQVVITLAQSYEQARLDEVKNLPVITFVEAPNVPVRPDARRTIVRTLIGMALGFCLALFIAVLLEVFLRDAQRERELSTEYADLAARSSAELKKPGRALRRLLGLSRGPTA